MSPPKLDPPLSLQTLDLRLAELQQSQNTFGTEIRSLLTVLSEQIRLLQLQLTTDTAAREQALLSQFTVLNLNAESQTRTMQQQLTVLKQCANAQRCEHVISKHNQLQPLAVAPHSITDSQQKPQHITAVQSQPAIGTQQPVTDRERNVAGTPHHRRTPNNYQSVESGTPPPPPPSTTVQPPQQPRQPATAAFVYLVRSRSNEDIFMTSLANSLSGLSVLDPAHQYSILIFTENPEELTAWMRRVRANGAWSTWGPVRLIAWNSTATKLAGKQALRAKLGPSFVGLDGTKCPAFPNCTGDAVQYVWPLISGYKVRPGCLFWFL